MQANSIDVVFPNNLYHKIGTIASEHFEITKDYIIKVVSDSIREEFELRDIKRQIASRYATDEVSYESLKTLLGVKEAERIRIYRETILESLREADDVAKRLNCLKKE